jgi:hypothetical protein
MTAHVSFDTALTTSHTAPTRSRIPYRTHHAAPLGRVAGTIPIVLFTCADAGAEHHHELGENFRYDNEHVVRFPRLLPFSARVLTWWTVARGGIASLYVLDSITDDDELRLSTSSITIPTCCVRSTAASPLMCVTYTSPAVASISLTLF